MDRHKKEISDPSDRVKTVYIKEEIMIPNSDESDDVSSYQMVLIKTEVCDDSGDFRDKVHKVKSISGNPRRTHVSGWTIDDQSKENTNHLVKNYCPKCKSIHASNDFSKICRKCQASNMFHCLKPHCSAKYKRLYSLRGHIKREHLADKEKSYEKSYSCVTCGKSFGVDENLRKHQMTCGKEAHLRCEHCDFRTKWPRTLSRHVMRWHKDVIEEQGKIRRCKECGNEFLQAESLKIHTERYCGKSVQTFRCAHCTYFTRCRLELVAHLKTEHNFL